MKFFFILHYEILIRCFALSDTFLELLEPYILKDMLSSLPPEVLFYSIVSIIPELELATDYIKQFVDNASAGRTLQQQRLVRTS